MISNDDAEGAQARVSGTTYEEFGRCDVCMLPSVNNWASADVVHVFEGVGD